MMFNPSNDAVRLKLGMAYLQASRLEDAKLAVEQALRLNPANKSAREVLTEIIQQLKQNKR
jgi:Tfp pilus assembly protein PilF